jgi:hypothetical protein
MHNKLVSKIYVALHAPQAALQMLPNFPNNVALQTQTHPRCSSSFPWCVFPTFYFPSLLRIATVYLVFGLPYLKDGGALARKFWNSTFTLVIITIII